MQLNDRKLDAEFFTYHAPTNTWVAEASDLPRDFCMEGFTLVRGGREVRYVLDATHRDTEGDITHWTLRPANRDQWAAGRVTIFND